jgi:hypothetical protein
MEQTAEKLQQEYWRPANPHGKREMPMDARSRADVCEGCGSEFIIGARFCHVCGTTRQEAARTTPHWMEVLDFDRIRHTLGLSVGSLVAFIFGMVCVIAAIAVGFIYSASTLVDWQAVQTWRIEWMLAAVVAFVAGILLKKAE